MLSLHLLAAFALLFSALVLAQNNSIGTTYNTTITWYGTNDQNGSPNCNSNNVACGFYTYVRPPPGPDPRPRVAAPAKYHPQPGYAASVSQNLFGAGPGQGSGAACGTCYRLTIETDEGGNRVANAGSSIVVMVNNLCPAANNSLCAQPDLQTPNSYGGVVDFNLCNDDGAHAALLTPAGTGLARGTAAEVSCAEWNGTKKTDCGSDCNGKDGIDSGGENTVIGLWIFLLPFVLMVLV